MPNQWYNVDDGSYQVLLPNGKFTKRMSWEQALITLQPLVGQYPWHKQPSA